MTLPHPVKSPLRISPSMISDGHVAHSRMVCRIGLGPPLKDGVEVGIAGRAGVLRGARAHIEVVGNVDRGARRRVAPARVHAGANGCNSRGGERSPRIAGWTGVGRWSGVARVERNR